MFGLGTSLRYLNLKLFKKEVSSSWDIENIFNLVPRDAIICIDDDYTKHYLLDPEPYRLEYAICSETCKTETNTKIDFDNQKCLDSCETCLDGKKCTRCKSDHFMTIKPGICKEKSLVYNCSKEVTTDFGCEGCVKGYYLKDRECYECNDTCASCIN